MANSANAGLLIILSGLPAAGKSTIARLQAAELFATWLRVDTIVQALARSSLRLQPAEDAGYIAAYALAEDNLRLGRTVIADSVNPIEISREAWRKVATETGCRAIEVEVICSDGEEHKRRVETRQPDIEGHRLPTWKQVQQREYEPWQSDRLVIDTAGNTADECVRLLLNS